MTELDRARANVRDATFRWNKATNLDVPAQPSRTPDFAAMAAHDLLEPVRKIIACCERLEARITPGLDEPSREDVRRVRSSAGRMRGLIDSLLELTTATNVPARLRTVPLGPLVAEVVADTQEQFQNMGGRVLVADLPTVVANRDQLRQVFHNLLANALKFRAEERPLLVRIRGRRVGAQMCEVTVADNGIGVEEDKDGRIFLPFQRGRAVAKTSGSGLGLAICRTILARHKGSIAVRGGPGVGTTFIVMLPLGIASRAPGAKCGAGVPRDANSPFAASEPQASDLTTQNDLATQSR